jgi:hypothetical protein
LAFAVTWLLPEKPLRQTAHIGAQGVGEELLVGLAQTDPETPVELAAHARETRRKGCFVSLP